MIISNTDRSREGAPNNQELISLKGLFEYSGDPPKISPTSSIDPIIESVTIYDMFQNFPSNNSKLIEISLLSARRSEIPGMVLVPWYYNDQNGEIKIEWFSMKSDEYSTHVSGTYGLDKATALLSELQSESHDSKLFETALFLIDPDTYFTACLVSGNIDAIKNGFNAFNTSSVNNDEVGISEIANYPALAICAILMATPKKMDNDTEAIGGSKYRVFEIMAPDSNGILHKVSITRSMLPNIAFQALRTFMLKYELTPPALINALAKIEVMDINSIIFDELYTIFEFGSEFPKMLFYAIAHGDAEVSIQEIVTCLGFIENRIKHKGHQKRSKNYELVHKLADYHTIVTKEDLEELLKDAFLVDHIDSSNQVPQNLLIMLALLRPKGTLNNNEVILTILNPSCNDYIKILCTERQYITLMELYINTSSRKDFQHRFIKATR